MARKRDDTIKLVLRLPAALHRQLGRAALRNNQSLNSEMVRRLQESVSREGLMEMRGEVERQITNKEQATEVVRGVDTILRALGVPMPTDKGEKK
jgi:hypothetical protein